MVSKPFNLPELCMQFPMYSDRRPSHQQDRNQVVLLYRRGRNAIARIRILRGFKV